MTTIQSARTEAEVRDCWAVMAELRPQFTDIDRFAEQIARQQRACGYHLAMRRHEGRVVTVAGYRYAENLAWGRHMYVDDLVTASASRGQGHAGAMMRWLIEQARQHGCEQLHLDSGVQRFDAHRFYLILGMNITSHHFAMRVL